MPTIPNLSFQAFFIITHSHIHQENTISQNPDILNHQQFRCYQNLKNDSISSDNSTKAYTLSLLFKENLNLDTQMFILMYVPGIILNYHATSFAICEEVAFHAFFFLKFKNLNNSLALIPYLINPQNVPKRERRAVISLSDNSFHSNNSRQSLYPPNFIYWQSPRKKTLPIYI